MRFAHKEHHAKGYFERQLLVLRERPFQIIKIKHRVKKMQECLEFSLG